MPATAFQDSQTVMQEVTLSIPTRKLASMSRLRCAKCMQYHDMLPQLLYSSATYMKGMSKLLRVLVRQYSSWVWYQSPQHCCLVVAELERRATAWHCFVSGQETTYGGRREGALQNRWQVTNTHLLVEVVTCIAFRG